MKTKWLLFALFLLYWAGVYGVTFFSDTATRSKIKNSFIHYFVPTGYTMFSPVTQSAFNVKFEFFKDGEKKGELNSWDYLNESHKLPIERKEIFLKKMVYFYRIPDLDYQYLKNDYDRKYRDIDEDLDSIFQNDHYLSNMILKIRKSSQLLIDENPEWRQTDSVGISIQRYPIILSFDPEYKGSYTFYVSDTVFFQTSYIPEKFVK